MKVTYNGAEHALPEPSLADMVAFERKFNMPSSVLGNESASRLEWVCFLAWRGLRRLDANGGLDFGDAFIDGLDFVDEPAAADDAPAEIEAEDPTDPAAPAS